MWSAVAGDGYCGYEVLRRLHNPEVLNFHRSDPTLRAELKTFLSNLESSIGGEIADDVLSRLTAAIDHLN
jgi:hypothetical protein